MNEWYILEQGNTSEQTYSKNELSELDHFTPGTMVYDNDRDEWVEAVKIPELKDLFEEDESPGAPQEPPSVQSEQKDGPPDRNKTEEPETLFCPNCGSEINANTKYCPKCGEEVSGSSEQPKSSTGPGSSNDPDDSSQRSSSPSEESTSPRQRSQPSKAKNDGPSNSNGGGFFDLARERSFLQAVGFYVVVFIALLIASAPLGMVMASDFQQGLVIGQVFAIITSFSLGVAIQNAKNQTDHVGYWMLTILAGLLAAVGGGILGLIPIAILSTRPAS